MAWELAFPNPNPALSPLDVVKIQLDALQNNDLMPDNAGIRLAFRYASPIHKKAFRTLAQFLRLLKNPQHRAMIGFERALLDTMYISNGNARQTVHLLHKEDAVSYLFLLSIQHDEPFVNCWMTDAMLRRQ